MLQFTCLSVCFVFASTGIGGAERTMLRLIQQVHPDRLCCTVLMMTKHNTLFTNILNKLGVECHEFNSFQLVALWRTIHDLEPDVVYIFGNIRTLVWAISARMAGVQTVIVAERSIPTHPFVKLGRRADRFFSDAFITNSHAAAHILQSDCGIEKKRIHVIYNGIDTKKSHAMVDASPIDIICVANIRPLKGHLTLLKAIKRLQNKYPLLACEIFGKDLTDGAFFRQVETENLQNTFQWRGFSENIEADIGRSKIFVLPSLEREGTPTSILEAMNAGVAVIASDVGGVSELVLDGVTGYLVPPGDIEQLADRLDQLLSHPLMRQQFGINAKKHVQKHHSIELMVEQHLQVFQKLSRHGTVQL